MKKLWKGLSIGLLTMMMAAGCSSNTAQPEENTDDTPVTETTWEDQLIEKGKISIGISPDYPPYESYDENNEIVGYDVDMMNELTKYLGTEDAPYEIEWVEMSFEMIISSVQLGQVDIGVAGFTYDPERQVLFSDPYLESAQVIIVKSDSGIETTKDLNGKLIGVQAGTTGESAAGNIEGATLNSVTDAQLLVESLNAGSIDAMVADKAVAENYVNNIEGLTILEEPLIDEQNCIITAEGKDALIEKINEAIAQFNESDAQQQLKEKWGL